MTEPNAVKSPCVNICVLDEQDMCTGCYRNVDEIARWSSISEQEKREIVVRAEQRYREAWGVSFN